MRYIKGKNKLPTCQFTAATDPSIRWMEGSVGVSQGSGNTSVQSLDKSCSIAHCTAVEDVVEANATALSVL